jgi:hypothetical protein
MGTDAPYLAAEAFRAAHRGPYVVDGRGIVGTDRDPSPSQIAAMCAAIRATWSKSRCLNALGRTVKHDKWYQHHAPAEPTHVPHGISAEDIGASACRDIFS